MSSEKEKNRVILLDVFVLRKRSECLQDGPPSCFCIRKETNMFVRNPKFRKKVPSIVCISDGTTQVGEAFVLVDSNYESKQIRR